MALDPGAVRQLAAFGLGEAVDAALLVARHEVVARAGGRVAGGGSMFEQLVQRTMGSGRVVVRRFVHHSLHSRAIRSANRDLWLTVGFSFATVAMAIATGLRFAGRSTELHGQNQTSPAREEGQ